MAPAVAAARAADSNAAVLFTAHSVPCRTIMTPAEPNPIAHPTHPDGLQHYGHVPDPDPYPVECKFTASAIAKLLGLKDSEWFFAFQSQGVAGAPWIGPTVEDTLTALAADGHKAVAIQPVGFLCDHVEILYDIDINFRDFAAPLGIALHRASSLNDSPTLIRAISHVLSTAQ